MKVTAQEEYGLRCLIQLAIARGEKRALTAAEIAEWEGLGTPFVGKILATLKAGGLVTSERGAKKGFLLSRTPDAIMLDEVLTVLGGRLFTGAYCDEHTGKRDDCVHKSACNVRPVWGSLELIMSSVLRRVSLADLLGSESAIRSLIGKSFLAGIREPENTFAVASRADDKER